ncbi:MAG: YhbY family RNA-binding protein, partial [Candidatus Thermoplasmatota archaeon]|nr:YhbY family RNA-binding protein [Candidatus Thermoplasmatota archaeon]
MPRGIIKQAKDSSLPVTVRIGKGGVTEQVIVELREQLGKRGLVKLKANRGLLSNSQERTSCFEG